MTGADEDAATLQAAWAKAEAALADRSRRAGQGHGFPGVPAGAAAG